MVVEDWYGQCQVFDVCVVLDVVQKFVVLEFGDFGFDLWVGQVLIGQLVFKQIQIVVVVVWVYYVKNVDFGYVDFYGDVFVDV